MLSVAVMNILIPGEGRGYFTLHVTVRHKQKAGQEFKVGTGDGKRSRTHGGLVTGLVSYLSYTGQTYLHRDSYHPLWAKPSSIR